MRVTLSIVAAMFCLCAAVAQADNNCGDGFTQDSFMRNDMVALKDHMKSVVAAIGALPAPYALEKGNWSLPASACRGKNGFRPISVSYDSNFSTAAVKQKLEQNAKQAAVDYQKKIIAAEASGNYQSIQKMVAQMQAQALQQAMPVQQKKPVSVSIRTNVDDSSTIDPDAVLRDGAGFIAMRTSSDPADEQATFLFDPVVLKNAHQLASFDMGDNKRTLHKLDLLNIEIILNGPKESVDSLVKNLDAGKVLSQLSEARAKGSE